LEICVRGDLQANVPLDCFFHNARVGLGAHAFDVINKINRFIIMDDRAMAVAGRVSPKPGPQFRADRDYRSGGQDIVGA
jgi:hypothetical protein